MINLAFLVDDLCSLCGVSRNILENSKWLNRERFRIFIYALYGKIAAKEFRGLKDVTMRMTNFNKFSPASYVKLMRLLKHDAIEVIHCYPFVSNLVGPILAKSCGVKKIITSVHSEAIIRNILIRKLSYGLSDRIVTVSEYLKSFLKNNKIVKDAKKIVTIYNGIDIDLFSPEKACCIDKKNMGLQDSDLIAVTTAKLTWEKGHKYLLRAIKRLDAATVSRVKFLFAGAGPLERELKSISRELGIEERVVFMGYRDDIRELLSLCDLFVLPSVSEGQGIALLEAMAMKRPVVTTDAGGIQEVVKDGKNGIVVKPADPDGLSRALRNLLNNRPLRIRMGAEGRRVVVDRFDARNKAKELENLYLDLTDE